MPAALITSKEHLIVAGGTTGPYTTDNINTVEVMDTKTLLWSTAAMQSRSSLLLYSLASATIDLWRSPLHAGRI